MRAIHDAVDLHGPRRRVAFTAGARIASGERGPSRCRRWIGGTTAVVGSVIWLTGVLPGAASASGTTHTEHFTFLSTNVPADKFNVIATGPFTDGGTATPLASSNKLTFPDGTIETVSKSKGAPVTSANTKTCYESLFEQGTYRITGGTGKYRGITGSGTFTLHIHEIGPKVNGKCDTSTSKRVASQGILTAQGPVTLG